MNEQARAAAEQVVEWWRGQYAAVFPDDWYPPLVDKVTDAVAQAVKERDEELALARAANTVLQVRYENERVLFCPEAHAVAPDGTDEPECPTCDALAEKAEEIARLQANADFLRESVGECHLMISRNTLEFQLKQDWDSTTLPPRFRAFVQAAVTAERERHAQTGGDADGHYCTICRAAALRAPDRTADITPQRPQDVHALRDQVEREEEL